MTHGPKKPKLYWSFSALSRLQRVEVDACTNCDECFLWCPVYDALREESLTPRGKLKTIKSFASASHSLWALLFGPRPINEEKFSKFTEDLYRCTTCGTCQVICESAINTTDLWEKLRFEMVKLGKGPLGKQNTWLDLVKQTYNLYNEPTEDRLNWLPPDIKTSKKASIGYFVGCTSSYRTKAIAIDTTRILKHLNVDFVLLGPEEYCCGSPLIRTGQLNVVKKLVEHNVNSLTDRGVQRVLYSCAGCFRTSIIDWPRFFGRLPFEPLHITQFLAEKIDEGKLRFEKGLDANITYHDPCHLGRHARVFEAPRKIIESIHGSRFIEMQRNKILSRCCGAGGGVKAAIPDVALKMAAVRVQDALEIGADILTSACPFCCINLRNAIDWQKEQFRKLKIVDLVELIAHIIRCQQ